MPHANDNRVITDPRDPLAFFNIPLATRNGALDAICPTCEGHGQWNAEIDMVSFRSRRAICPTCWGNGWIETGEDLIEIPDIIYDIPGQPHWIRRLVPRDYLEGLGGAGHRL